MDKKKKIKAAVNTDEITPTESKINDMIENEKSKEIKPAKETINEDEVLFKIWHIICAFDKALYIKLIQSDVKTMTDLKTKNLNKLIDTIDFDSMNEYTTKEKFIQKVKKFNPTVYPDGDQSCSSDSSSDNENIKDKKQKKKKRKKGKKNRIGFSVGGAKDINSFRLNIDNNIMPKDSSITYEGIFYDYYFDTGSGDEQYDDNKDQDHEKKPLFFPSYNYAKSKQPKALKMTLPKTQKTDDTKDDMEYFMTIGLNSNIKESDFNRKKLNMVIVLDISGSMRSGFGGGGRRRGKKRRRVKGRRGRGGVNSTGSKMRVANECVLSILTHLNHDDKFGLVLFQSNAETYTSFKKMSDHKLNDIERILRITPRGGTNFEAGYNAALNMFENDCKEYDINEYENRIIFLTDACPNVGKTDPKSLMSLTKRAAMFDDKSKRIYSTFVGVGLDFNSDLIQEITKVRGANYFSVHSAKEFFQRLDLEFDYIVSPMVFDLRLTLQCEGIADSCIQAVYGSDDIDIKSGEIMKVNTLFPSPPDDSGNIKGGIVLIKLRKADNINYDNLIVDCSYENKYGKIFKSSEAVVLKGTSNENDNEKSDEFYGNLGIRKGLLLTRYVLLMKEWIKTGSGNIQVSNKFKKIFKLFVEYFQSEMEHCKDETLKKEVTLLNKLINHKQMPYPSYFT